MCGVPGSACVSCGNPFLLAGYGATADFDRDGVLSPVESAAVRATILSLPVLTDEKRTPSSRLAYAYNVSRGLDTPASSDGAANNPAKAPPWLDGSQPKPTGGARKKRGLKSSKRRDPHSDPQEEKHAADFSLSYSALDTDVARGKAADVPWGSGLSANMGCDI